MPVFTADIKASKPRVAKKIPPKEITIFESVEIETKHDIDERDTNDVDKNTPHIPKIIKKHKYEIIQDLQKLFDCDQNFDSDDDDDEYLAVNNTTAQSYMKDVFSAANIEPSNVINPFGIESSETTIIDNIEAHAALIQLIQKYELEVSRIPHYKWNENFSVTARKILKLHADSRLLDDLCVLFAKWSAYIETHQQHPLCVEIFLKILDSVICQCTKSNRSKAFKIKLPGQIKIYPAAIARVLKVGSIQRGIPDPLNNNNIHLKAKTDVVKFFWDSAYKLFDNFLSFVQDLHYDLNSLEVLNKGQTLKKICIIISQFENIDIPDDYKERNFKECVKESLIYGTKEHFKRNININVLEDPNLNMKKIDELIIILKFVLRHLKEFDSIYGLVFESFYKESTYELLFSVYDTELTKIIKPVISMIGKIKREDIKNMDEADENGLRKIIELYKEMKNFSDHVEKKLGNADFKLKNYQKWFMAEIDVWRKFIEMRDLVRIEKSVEIDKLKPEFDSAKFSSSAIDTIQILYGTKQFWEDLKWFDTNEKENLVEKIVMDICYVSVVYFEKFIEKIENSVENEKRTIDKVSSHLSVAIGNYKYICENHQKLMNEFIKNNKISDKSGIQKQINDTKENLCEKIHQFLATILKLLYPTMREMIVKSAKDKQFVEYEIFMSLTKHIKDMLKILHTELARHEFGVAKSILWRDILEMFSEIAKDSINEKMEKEFFENLLKIFFSLNDTFQYIEPESTINKHKKTQKIEKLLQYYAMETPQLIHHYYKDRYEIQQQAGKNLPNPHSYLTVKVHFNGLKLKIEIIKANELFTYDMNRKCDSYVKVQIIPERSFPTHQNFKTKVQQSDNFPSYDEVFEIELTKEQKLMREAIIYFNVKNKYLIASNDSIAEAFLAFKHIPESEKVKPMELTLTRLQSDDLESFKAIQYRSQIGDKNTKDLLAKFTKLSKTP
ncbi:protein unc-13 homolog 4B-like isoform X2 [Chironomus tepperi]